MSDTTNLSRRDFLITSGLGAGGLLLSVALPTRAAGKSSSADATLSPSAWVSIDTDGIVTIWVGDADMGQGVRTALPMILADELEADWDDVRIEQAYPDPKFGNLGTGGSTSIRTSWNPLREAGATAREMLVGAAADEWDVSPSECQAERGAVVHDSGRRLAYGDLVEAAAERSVPEDPPLKDPSEFRYIGTSVPMLDTPDKVRGEAEYGLDVKVPGMVYAAVARCPVFGGRVADYDASAALEVEGVQEVIEIEPVGTPVHAPGGIAVIANNTWAAMKGRDALDVTWAEGENAQESSETLREQFRTLVSEPGTTVRDDGDAEAALQGAAQTIEATYELPYLAHVTMEPMNCTARVEDGRVELWAPTQTPTWAQGSVAEALNVPQEAVHVNVTLLGGGFGRRLNPDVPVEAALIAREIDAPVKVVWTREDDVQHDFYRPASHHHFRGGIDDGQPVAWMHRMSTPAIDTYIQGENAENPESGEVPGAADLPYGIPNIRVEYALAESGVPRGWWRSVEHSFNGFVVNAFMDEMAAACEQDPYEFRLRLLDQVDRARLDAMMQEIHGDQGDFAFNVDRYRGVLERAAEEAGWGDPLPDGRGRGIAVHWSFLSYAATVVEATVDNGEVQVDRAVGVIDCGAVINPMTVREQLQGGIIDGLTQALKSEITIEGGRVVQSNFDDYHLMRMNEVPDIDVHIVESGEPPSGSGEPAVPTSAPALAGAIYDAADVRIRRLPIRAEDLQQAQ